eukprot:c17539_g1_i2 orf=283-714(-)
MGQVLYQLALFPRLPSHSLPPHQQAKLFVYHISRAALPEPGQSGERPRRHVAQRLTRHVARASWRWSDDDDDDVDRRESRDAADASFQHGVELFNRGEYYQCHDVMESMWMKSAEPKRSVLHAILQCSVGLYHLLNKVLRNCV